MTSEHIAGEAIAVIDIGTVTARLAVSHVREGRVELQEKISTIVNLGEGVDRSGELAPAAIERVATCVGDYAATARELGAAAIACTLTSAARDAGNSDLLLGRLRSHGIEPQVIPGEVEGRLTFLGVAQDFPGVRLLVADNGGGSTELAYGQLLADGTGNIVATDQSESDSSCGGLTVDLVRSTDVGCRRLTDRFLSRTDPPTADDLREAHEFAASLFSPVVEELQALGSTPERLVATGGTVTTLAAIEQQLVPYDSSRVHLHELTREQVAAIERRFAGLTVAERAEVAGMQAKRAPVILAGMVAIGELMDQTGFDRLTVSESDLLVGLTLALDAAVRGTQSPVGWVPGFALS